MLVNDTFIVKVDKIYLSTPTKIAILDHERKRTFVLRKDGLPDAGEFLFIHFSLLENYIMLRNLSKKIKAVF